MADAASTLLQRLRIAHGSPDRSPDAGALPPEVTEQFTSYFETLGELAATNPRAFEAFVRAQDEAAPALAEHTAAAGSV